MNRRLTAGIVILSTLFLGGLALYSGAALRHALRGETITLHTEPSDPAPLPAPEAPETTTTQAPAQVPTTTPAADRVTVLEEKVQQLEQEVNPPTPTCAPGEQLGSMGGVPTCVMVARPTPPTTTNPYYTEGGGPALQAGS